MATRRERDEQRGVLGPVGLQRQREQRFRPGEDRQDVVRRAIGDAASSVLPEGAGADFLRAPPRSSAESRAIAQGPQFDFRGPENQFDFERQAFGGAGRRTLRESFKRDRQLFGSNSGSRGAIKAARQRDRQNFGNKSGSRGAIKAALSRDRQNFGGNSGSRGAIKAARARDRENFGPNSGSRGAIKRSLASFGQKFGKGRSATVAAAEARKRFRKSRKLFVSSRQFSGQRNVGF